MITLDHDDNIRERKQAVGQTVGDPSLFAICCDQRPKELSP